MAVPKERPPLLPVVDLSHLGFDSTERVEYQKREGRLRGTELYFTTGLVAEMEDVWQTNLLAVKTVTDRKSFQVYVFNEPDPEAEGATAVRKSETLAAATISFYIPLQLLSLKLSKDRQVTLVPTLVDAGEKGIAYCFDLRSLRAKKSKKGAGAAPGKADGDAAATASEKSAAK